MTARVAKVAAPPEPTPPPAPKPPKPARPKSPRHQQHLTDSERAAAKRFIEALQAQDYRECRKAARAFLPPPVAIPRDPVERKAHLQDRIREQLANAERDGSHVAAMRLLKMLVEGDAAAANAEAGPSRADTPEAHKARVLEWAEITIEALLDGGVEAEILTDPRIVAAVDAAREGR